MSQRDSGYDRKENDLYETPEWVTGALVPFIFTAARIWEPACGGNKITDVLRRAAWIVHASDITGGRDFLSKNTKLPVGVDTIITNPPYTHATEFVERALEHNVLFVAMLLRTDFDHAKTRRHLFKDEPRFARKLVLTKRIVWFERPGKKKASPSYNHAWFIWERTHKGPPILAYQV